MTEPASAPYPADTKAKGWRFELDLEQVRQSDTWALAAPATRPWLLMLWATAWEQVPCGSLPKDDALIAARIGMDAKAFAKVRDVLLRGWRLADDGRLYHETITNRVQAMLAKKDKDRQRKAGWRARQSGGQFDESQDSHLSVPRDSNGTDGGLTLESNRKDDTKHQAPSTNTQPNGCDAPKVGATTKRGSRLAQGWQLPKAWGEWVLEKYPHWTEQIVRDEALKFSNHWHAATGKTASRLDWYGTWQNWCMSDICQRAHPAPVVAAHSVTTPSNAAEETQRALAAEAEATRIARQQYAARKAREAQGATS